MHIPLLTHGNTIPLDMKVHSVGKLIHGVITRLSGTGPVRIPTKTRGGSREAGRVGEVGGVEGESTTVKQVCVKVVAIFLRTTNDEVHSDPMSVDIVRGE